MKYQDYECRFQQDGAPAQSAKATIEELMKKMTLLLGWPPNSSDLIPIEIIWGNISIRLSHLVEQPSKSEDFCVALQLEWDSIPHETIDKMIRSFSRRLTMTRKLGGKVPPLLTCTSGLWISTRRSRPPRARKRASSSAGNLPDNGGGAQPAPLGCRRVAFSTRSAAGQDRWLHGGAAPRRGVGATGTHGKRRFVLW